MSKYTVQVRCLLCGTSRPVYKTGARALAEGKDLVHGVKGLFQFGKEDPRADDTWFIDVRRCVGGGCKDSPERGFPRALELCYTLTRTLDEPGLRPLALNFIESARAVAEILKEV